MTDIAQIIDDAFERRTEISPSTVDPTVKDAIEEALSQLDAGAARVAEKVDGKWHVNQWLKKAV
ncbi:MAG: 2,3,4,5-tetrahydropyridine-2,6-dicarboxylate N-succinyltransferase, partial [Saprospiraceae bacterium]|nr:2,3,4,5-tetrahydropyridine-2,6-dicarboxylate N-succinyltransferase [Saprospiraceae bacterium]